MLKAEGINRGKDFSQYRGMIIKMAKAAWGRLTQAGVAIEFEDVFQEMCLIYCVAVEKFDPSKVAEGKSEAQFITYLWTCIRNDYNKVADRLIREAVGEVSTRHTYDEHEARAAEIAGLPYEGKIRKSGKFNGFASLESLGDAEFDAYDVIPSGGMTPEDNLISSRYFSDGYRQLDVDSRMVVKALLKQAIPDCDDDGNVIDPDVTFINTTGRRTTVKRSEMKIHEIMLSMNMGRSKIHSSMKKIEQAFDVSLKGCK